MLKRQSVFVVQQENKEILHFSLQGLFPSGHMFSLNTNLGTLSHLAIKQDWPILLTQAQFTSTEMSVLLPLLSHYPHYCPCEVLLASFTSGRVTDAALACSRKRLQEARELGMWDLEMRAVRNALSRMRLKLRTLGIEATSIMETGYILTTKNPL